MTALKDFERLECQGVWRASPEAQRRDVIVSVGDATLTLADQTGTALVHWSLPALERANPGEEPALYRPGPDSAETLELTDELMIGAIEKVQTAIERRRPHPGRLRFYLTGGTIALIAGLALFWLPGAMVDYTASVVPATKRAAIGEDLLSNIRRVAGKSCDEPLGLRSLRKLHTRLFDDAPGKIVVLSGGVRQAEHLPGNIILLNRALVEDFEEAEVAAGYALAEDMRARAKDPLVRLLRELGFMASFRLLTTGDIPDEDLAAYSEKLLLSEPLGLNDAALIARFERARVRISPYAYAIDISGETTVNLIESDQLNAQKSAPVLDDGDWVSLQSICGE